MILKNYTYILEKLKPTEKTKLLVVTKQQPIENIRILLEAGHRLFGENRVQEAQEKWPALLEEYPDCKLHLIGPLQTNKVRDAVRLFDCIQTLDRPKLIRKFVEELAETEKQMEFFIQVNTGREAQKSGVTPEQLDTFHFLAEEFGLSVTGLMCIPPYKEDPTSHFQYLKKKVDSFGMREVSMGMSEDYEKAIECGSTLIRVGRQIFGER